MQRLDYGFRFFVNSVRTPTNLLGVKKKKLCIFFDLRFLVIFAKIHNSTLFSTLTLIYVRKIKNKLFSCYYKNFQYRSCKKHSNSPKMCEKDPVLIHSIIPNKKYINSNMYYTVLQVYIFKVRLADIRQAAQIQQDPLCTVYIL